MPTILNTVKSLFQTKEQQIIQKAASYWRSMYSGGFNGCGKVKIDLHTMYRVPKMNKMAWAYMDKITQMVWQEGFSVVDPITKEVIEDSEALQRASDFFRCWVGDAKTFGNFVQDFFLQYFCSGEVSITSSELNLYSRASRKSYAKVLDTRGVMKHFDAYGEPKSYEYYFDFKTGGKEDFTAKQLCNLILLRDHNQTGYGYSKFERIIVEALTNLEASQRQLYMFTNNSAPWLMIMLDPETFDTTDGGKAQIDGLRDMWNSKFRGSANANKPLVSDIVKEIKQLDVSNVEMDYLNIRKENDKDFAAIFLLDPRLVWVVKDTGSFGEVESVTIRQGNQQIDSYSQVVAQTMTLVYKKFIDPNFAHEFKLHNAQFRDIDKEKDTSLKEVEMWVKTPNEHRMQFGMEEVSEPHMDEYIRGRVSIRWWEEAPM